MPDNRIPALRRIGVLLITALGLSTVLLPVPAASADEASVVVTSNYVLLSAGLDGGAATLSAVTSDRSNPTADDANPVSHTLDEIVVVVPESFKTTLPTSETTAGAGWRAIGPENGDYWETSLRSGSTTTGLVPGLNTRDIASSDIASGSKVTFTVDDFAGPGAWVSGLNSATRGNPFPSTRLDSFTEGSSYALNPATSTTQYWGFTAAGVYCISLSVTVTPNGAVEPITSSVGTIRVAVGDIENPETAECGSGEGGYVPPEADVMDPASNQLLSITHADIAARLEPDNSLGLYLRPGSSWKEFANTIFFLPDAVQTTIPDATGGYDVTYIAPAGSPIWVGPGNASLDAPWLGYSSEEITDSSFERLLTWTVNGVAGIDGGAAPGDFFLGGLGGDLQAAASAGGSPLFSTKQGMPQALQMIPARWAHKHTTWEFTAAGTYCIDMGMSARLADGTPVGDRQVLTVVVGGTTLNPTSMQTCIQAGVTASGTPKVQVIEAPATAEPTVVAPASSSKTLTSRLTPTVRDGELSIDLVVDDQRGAGTAYDPDDVVIQVRTPGSQGTLSNGSAPYHSSAGERYWETGGGGAGSIGLGWSGLGVDAAELSGDIGWRMLHVSGGEFVLSDNYTQGVSHQPVFSNRVGYESDSYPIWPGTVGGYPTWTFKASGVYCITFEWSATAVGGAALGPVQKTLTFAVGIDPANVLPCSWEDNDGGGEGGDGGEDIDPGDEMPLDWSDIPVSGRHVLDGGHVDIRSVLTATDHTVAVHDDNTSPATQRPLDNVTFAVPPLAEQTVPGESRYAFLGGAGDPVWVLPQTVQAGLVWPGWNLDVSGGSSATAVRWTLDNVNGPGEFALYEILEFGAVGVRLDSDDPAHAAFEFTEHGHANWAFGAEGVYCVDLTVSPVPAVDGLDRMVTLLFGVGDVDPERVDVDQCGKTPAQITGSERPTAAPDPIDDAQLTAATRGEVDAVADALAPGESTYVYVGDALSGRWVFAWLHSTPTPLDWHRVSSTGYIQITVPAGMSAGDHQIVIADRDGALIGWDGLVVTGAAAPPPPAPEQPSSDAPAQQCVAGSTILSSGHIDLAARIVSGRIETLIGDESGGAKVYREPTNTVLWLKPSSAVTLPAGYGAVGPAGSTVWQIPQTQNGSLIWVGWSTEALNAGNVTGPVWLSLDSVSGPGSVTIYTQTSFGGVQQVVFDGGGSRNVGAGIHAHANWAFSAQGVYRLDFTYSVTLANGTASSDRETVTIVVGDVDPASAAGGSGCDAIPASALDADDAEAAKQSAAQVPAAVAATPRDVAPGQGSSSGGMVDPITALNAGNPVPLLLSILGVLLLAGAAGTGVQWWRRRAQGARS